MMLAGFLGFSTAVVWGVGDFLGGSAARRVPAVVAVLVSQAVAAIVAAGALPIVRPVLPDMGSVGWSVAAGVSLALAVSCLYGALARAEMGVVAPFSAVVAGALPLLLFLASGGRPGLGPVIGVVAATAGIILAGGIIRPADGRPASGVPWSPTVLAGVGYGLLYVTLAAAADDRSAETTLWIVVLSRIVAVGILAAVVFTRRGGRPPLPRSVVGPLAAAGCLDASANALFILGSQRAETWVVAVLASLYPVTTAVLAFAFHRERLDRYQITGAVLAVIAVALLAL
jgi:drug/metabolite transporter (DMT)-like permease